MKVAIGCDHGGFVLKTALQEMLLRSGHQLLDCGAHSFDPEDDYPDFTQAVGEAIQRHEADRGLIICGSGVGASVAANKLRGIRAGLCHDTYSAHQGVEDDNINVLCLGGWVVGSVLAEEIVIAFLSARFSGAERHLRRLGKVAHLEQGGVSPLK